MKQKRPAKKSRTQPGSSTGRIAVVTPDEKKRPIWVSVFAVLFVLGIGILLGWLFFTPSDSSEPAPKAVSMQSPATSANHQPSAPGRSPSSDYRSQMTDIGAPPPPPSRSITDQRGTFRVSDAPWPCTLNDVCPRDSLCNVSTGDCVYMGTGVSESPVIYSVYPTHLSPGDTLLIDGDGLYMEAMDSSRVWKDGRWQMQEQVVVLSTVKIGGKIVTPEHIGEPDECRLIVTVSEDYSGPVSVEILPPDGKVYTATSKESIRVTRKLGSFQDCSDERRPKASGKPGPEPHTMGPYASSYHDMVYMDTELRIHYPAQCGGLRTPVADGQFPLIVILHGRGSAYLNYEYLARHLASWGFVTLLPNTVDIDVLDQVLTRITTKPSQVTPLIGAHIKPNGILIAGHSRGGMRASKLQDYTIGRYIKGIAMLAPFHPVRLSDHPILFVSGSEDRQAHPASVESFFERHKAQAWHFGMLGANHSQFTDRRHWDRTEALDGAAGIPRSLQHDIIRGVMLAFAQKVYGQTETFPEILRGELLPGFLFFARH